MWVSAVVNATVNGTTRFDSQGVSSDAVGSLKGQAGARGQGRRRGQTAPVGVLNTCAWKMRETKDWNTARIERLAERNARCALACLLLESCFTLNIHTERVAVGVRMDASGTMQWVSTRRHRALLSHALREATHEAWTRSEA